MTYYLAPMLCFLSCVQLSLSTALSGTMMELMSHRADGLATEEIGKEKAISIANRDAARRYGNLSRFRIVTCEQTRFSRIIYDGGGPEYVIDKSTGIIIRRQGSPKTQLIGVAPQFQAKSPSAKKRL